MSTSTADTLLSEITAFCARHDMSETAFGRESARDSHLVRRLRSHRSMTIRRMDQVREFMRDRDTAAGFGERVLPSPSEARAS